MVEAQLIIPLVILAVILAVIAVREYRGETHEVIRHMTTREKLAYFKLPAAVGLSVPLIGVGIGAIIHLAMPDRSVLSCLTISSAVLFPVLLVVVGLYKEPVRRYQRQMLLQTEWAKVNKLSEEEL